MYNQVLLLIVHCSFLIVNLPDGRQVENKYARKDSNPQPFDPKSNALSS